MQLFQREFGLHWEQINSIYNHLTEDSKQDLTFEKFEDLIKVLAHKKTLNDIEKAPLTLDQFEFDFLRFNADAILKAADVAELKAIVRSKLQSEEQREKEFGDETLERIWEKLEVFRKSPTPMNDTLKDVVIVDGSSTAERMAADSGRERALSSTNIDTTNEFERAQNRQIKNLQRLIAVCTSARQTDGSSAVAKLFMEVMLFGEKLHKGLDEMGRMLEAKNEYIAFINNEVEESKAETAKLQAKLEDFVVEISNAKLQTREFKRDFGRQACRTRKRGRKAQTGAERAGIAK